MFKNLLPLQSKNVLYIDADSIERTQNLEILEVLFKKTIVTDNDQDGVALYKENAPDLIIITDKTADINGVKFIQQLRQYDYHTPIMVLSKRIEHTILLEMANLSIDAYLYKPFNTEHFTKSVYQSIRRNSEIEELVVLGKHLLFNMTTQELFLNNSIVTLGTKELQLLLLLIKNRSKPTTKEEIRRNLWPLDSVCESAIKKLILRIRTKLATDIIVSVRGVGYQLNIEEITTIQQPLKSA